MLPPAVRTQTNKGTPRGSGTGETVGSHGRAWGRIFLSPGLFLLSDTLSSGRVGGEKGSRAPQDGFLGRWGH